MKQGIGATMAQLRALHSLGIDVDPENPPTFDEAIQLLRRATGGRGIETALAREEAMRKASSATLFMARCAAVPGPEFVRARLDGQPPAWRVAALQDVFPEPPWTRPFAPALRALEAINAREDTRIPHPLEVRALRVAGGRACGAGVRGASRWRRRWRRGDVGQDAHGRPR